MTQILYNSSMCKFKFKTYFAFLAGDYEVQGTPVTFTAGDGAESVKFVAIADNVKELNKTVSLMLQVVDDGGIDVELCPQSTTVVTIFDNNGKSGKWECTMYCVLQINERIVC